jgi:YD repeat-containing protein
VKYGNEIHRGFKDCPVFHEAPHHSVTGATVRFHYLGEDHLVGVTTTMGDRQLVAAPNCYFAEKLHQRLIEHHQSAKPKKRKRAKLRPRPHQSGNGRKRVRAKIRRDH